MRQLRPHPIADAASGRVYRHIEEPPLVVSDQAPPVDDGEVLFFWSSGFWCSAIT